MDSTLDVGRRIVQMFWDPEPTNDVVRDLPVWCLGSSYKLNNPSSSDTTADPATTTTAAATDAKSPVHAPSRLPETPPDSISSSFDSSLAYEDAPKDGGWPPAFLDSTLR